MKKILFLSLFGLMIVVVAFASVSDVNKDGSVNTGDVSALYSIILSGDNSTKGDINNDG